MDFSRFYCMIEWEKLLKLKVRIFSDLQSLPGFQPILVIKNPQLFASSLSIQVLRFMVGILISKYWLIFKFSVKKAKQ